MQKGSHPLKKCGAGRSGWMDDHFGWFNILLENKAVDFTWHGTFKTKFNFIYFVFFKKKKAFYFADVSDCTTRGSAGQ